MKIINSPLEGCYLLKENIIKDRRGHFLETFNYNSFKEKINLDLFVQENESFSRKKVIRGMHYQKYPYSQDKIIRVLSGKIWDIVIDLRPNSSSYLNSYGVAERAWSLIIFSDLSKVKCFSIIDAPRDSAIKHVSIPME